MRDETMETECTQSASGSNNVQVGRDLQQIQIIVVDKRQLSEVLDLVKSGHLIIPNGVGNGAFGVKNDFSSGMACHHDGYGKALKILDRVFINKIRRVLSRFNSKGET